MEFRLETFKSGNGFGFLGRIIFLTSIISYSVGIFKLIYLKQSLLSRYFDYLVVFFFLIVQILSGSKLGLLFPVFNTFIVMFFALKFNLSRDKEKKYKKIMYYMTFASIPLGILTVMIQNNSGSSFLEGLVTVALRFVNTGDIFYMSWVNDVISTFPSKVSDGFFAMFSDVLGTLRLMPRSELPQHLGLQVIWELSGTKDFMGPNLRHNVFGIFYFGGYGAILYSFILGGLVGFIRNRLYFKVPNNILGLSIYSILFQIALYIPQDFSSMAMSYLFTFLLIFPFLIIGSLLLARAS
jgi:hypothetical protein